MFDKRTNIRISLSLLTQQIARLGSELASESDRRIQYDQQQAIIIGQLRQDVATGIFTLTFFSVLRFHSEFRNYTINLFYTFLARISCL